MQIRKAMSRDLECIRELTRETIGQIYPKYYPQGAVEFFLSHHCDGAILADIRDGAVYLGIDETDGIVGTARSAVCLFCRNSSGKDMERHCLPMRKSWCLRSIRR